MAHRRVAFSLPFYTGDDSSADIRFVGPLGMILGLADLLHERTPYLDAMYYPRANEGILFTCVDRRALARLFKLQHDMDRHDLHHEVIRGADLMLGKAPVHAMTLRDLPITPYQGTIAQPRFHAKPSKASETLVARYYRFSDMPEAEIGRILGARFPVYSYQTRKTYLSYLAMSPKQMGNLLGTLYAAFPDIEFSLRFGLPYEDTAPLSPLQRKVERPQYLAAAAGKEWEHYDALRTALSLASFALPVTSTEN